MKLFVTNAQLLQQAKKEGYAIGAFNANNMEIVQAIIETAEEERAPVILQASQGAIQYAGVDYIAAMVRVAAEKATVPVALHLDHGTSFEQNIECIRAGFSSVMFDGSKLPLQENIAITKRVCDVAHIVGVSVEGELGQIPKSGENVTREQLEKMMANPAEAEEFVKKTGVDALAIAVGNVHGMKTQEAQIDIARIEKIRKLTDIPLVLHGASGIPDESVKKAIKAGICKINIDTELRKAFVRGISTVLKENPNEIDPRKILGKAKAEMKEAVREKIRLFGCNNKA
ncbi:MAG: class II fructose-1,6-bisphosphate aldolase [Candidatus Bathyarchaeia archaeon]|jgi:fructose-bisphosphate aldolase class II|nr:class II fructose-1,6-bisphosphate aldolase [Candidatus Bathyarchaeota archaeon A05DMB-4]MDH7595336.1 class II fructose-1,6-bisphosphate aldolase [Candidatus Bathyarchaeota archaeon]